MSQELRTNLMNELFLPRSDRRKRKRTGEKSRRLIERNFQTGRLKITKAYWSGVIIKRVSKKVGDLKGGRVEKFEMSDELWDDFVKYMTSLKPSPRMVATFCKDYDMLKEGISYSSSDMSLKAHFGPSKRAKLAGLAKAPSNVQKSINTFIAKEIDKWMRKKKKKYVLKHVRRKGMSFQHGVVGEAHSMLTREEFVTKAKNLELDSGNAPSMEDYKTAGKEKLKTAKRRYAKGKAKGRKQGGGDVGVASGGKGTLIDQRIMLGWQEAAKEFSTTTWHAEFNMVMAGFLEHMFGYEYTANDVIDIDKLISEYKVHAIMAPDIPGANPATQSRYVKQMLKEFLTSPEYFKDIAVSFAKMSEKEADNLFTSSPGKNAQSTAQVAKAMIQKLFPHKTNPDMRLKVNKKLANVKRKNRKVSGGAKPKGAKVKKQVVGQNTLSAGVAAMGATPSGQKQRTVDTMRTFNDQSPMALRNLLNEALPAAVAQNMVAPALRFRTGRLANSMRVDNITTGPRGGNMLIETSYDTDPYGTYAPGGKRYTAQRNPEALLRGSLRQIAMGVVGQRINIKVAK